ncbi:N-acetylneuraminate synthase [Cytophagaceae bacterium ABcell3]|nr:N-acetylneuraminate synthase [Cytophagaceae bacterium ABcell3]
MSKLKKTIIIAEAGVNHNGDLDMAFELIDKAAEAGADFVKFQTYNTERLVSPYAQKAKYQKENMPGGENQYDMLKRLELSEKDHYKLIDRCRLKNIGFLSSCFDDTSAVFLHNLGVAYIKIPSGELTNVPLLKKVASLGRPVILSTGMATMGEVEQAIFTLENHGLDKGKLTVLHCSSQYPTPFEEVNLKAMVSIQQAFKVQVGYSDHTEGIEVPIAATAMGGVMIEKHFTLDQSLPGPDHKASLEPEGLKKMVSAIRNIDIAMGDGIKKPGKSEMQNMEVVRKSVHARCDIQAGQVITETGICLKRPAAGLPPSMVDDIIGKKIARGKKANEPITLDDFLNKKSEDKDTNKFKS